MLESASPIHTSPDIKSNPLLNSAKTNRAEHALFVSPLSSLHFRPNFGRSQMIETGWFSVIGINPHLNSKISERKKLSRRVQRRVFTGLPVS